MNYYHISTFSTAKVGLERMHPFPYTYYKQVQLWYGLQTSSLIVRSQ